MNPGPGEAPSAPPDAALAAALFALDPSHLGGIALRARAGPVRDAWLKQLRDLLPAAAPVRRLPLHVGDTRLIGGLDLAATLGTGRPVSARGLLAEADGGVLILAMAERIPGATVARLSSVLDAGEVAVERDGTAGRFPARVGMVALDEGIDDERPHPALLERLAFHVDLDGLDAIAPAAGRDGIEAALACLPGVECDDGVLTALCETAVALGVVSLRAEVFALRVAKTSAALAGRTRVEQADAALAARLVLAPRATRLPVADAAGQASPDQPAASDPSKDDEQRSSSDGADKGEDRDASSGKDLGEIVLAAAHAAIPPGLLARLGAAAQGRPPSSTVPAGRSGAPLSSSKRGRPAGVRRGAPGAAARLNVIETLRAAAPWQKLRARAGDAAASGEAPASGGTSVSGKAPASGGGIGRMAIRRDDLRVTRFRQKAQSTTIFVVDASGSLAASRLAEAKGAVELLLAECYVRRDQVALLAFRGTRADLLLPPTRSLVRAKRSLAGLPGGGATPLALGIDAAVALGEGLRRRGQTPVIVFLTDGRANVARDGVPGRGRAEEDAFAAARVARATGMRTLVVDAAARPQAPARRLAQVMGALYLPLPRADATALRGAVRASSP